MVAQPVLQLALILVEIVFLLLAKYATMETLFLSMDVHQLALSNKAGHVTLELVHQPARQFVETANLFKEKSVMMVISTTLQIASQIAQVLLLAIPVLVDQ